MRLCVMETQDHGRAYTHGMDDTGTTRDTGSAAVEAAAESLKRYWRTGPGAARIRWGTPGDLTRCHDLVSRAAGVASETFDAWGFCNNLHKDIFGVPNPRD